MPRELPPHPRVLVTPAHIAFTRTHLAGCPWRRAALALLIERSAESVGFADDPRSPVTPETRRVYEAAVLHAARNALAFQLTRRAHHHREALRSLVSLTGAYASRPLTGRDCRAVGGGMYEAAFLSWLGCAYDLLAAEGFGDADLRVLQDGLAAGMEVVAANPHRTCSNHNTWGFRAGLSLAAAAGDREGIHAALYGACENGRKRYGFIHQLRHDLLADGIEWEHNLRHHFLTLAVYADVADRCRNLGIDLWHRTFPAALENEGADRHRDYGPSGEKSLRVAFDAPLYQLFPSGEFPLFGDSRLSHLRGLATWGIFYNLAYEAYEDSRHAWVLRCLEREWPERPNPALPATLQTATADLDFVRLLRNEWPEGRLILTDDAAVGLTGVHRGGCSHLPSNGSTLLRGDPDDLLAPAAFVFWGPHSAGHQGPAALHLELYAGGRRLTDAPWSASFDDPLHLAWCRTTIAHNTVTVDERSMYPYDRPTESIWESDEYHGRISDGRLIGFWPVSPYKAVRVTNAAVYPGVCLDRTVVVGPDFVLDLFRCLGEAEHQYDWAMHLPAERMHPKTVVPTDPGRERGYRQLREAGLWTPPPGEPALFGWSYPTGMLKGQVCATSAVRFILASGPDPSRENGFPGSDHYPTQACSALVARCRGRGVAFVGLFAFGLAEKSPPRITSLDGDPDGDMRITVERPDGSVFLGVFPASESAPGFRAG